MDGKNSDSGGTVSFIEHESFMGDDALRVILIHGALDRGMAFRQVAQRLHKYTTIAYDRRGYAASLGLGAASDPSVHVKDLLHVIDGRPAVLIGHSFGGLVAMIAAAEVPANILALGLFESPVPWDDSVEPSPDMADRPDDPDELVEWFFRRMVGDSAWESLNDGARASLRREGPALLADMTGRRLDKVTLSPSDVMLPAVVGYGSASRQYHIDRAAQLASELPDAELHVIEGAQHGAHRSHPAEFAAFAERVIARVS